MERRVCGCRDLRRDRAGETLLGFRCPPGRLPSCREALPSASDRKARTTLRRLARAVRVHAEQGVPSCSGVHRVLRGPRRIPVVTASRAVPAGAGVRRTAEVVSAQLFDRMSSKTGRRTEIYPGAREPSRIIRSRSAPEQHHRETIDGRHRAPRAVRLQQGALSRTAAEGAKRLVRESRDDWPAIGRSSAPEAVRPLDLGGRLESTAVRRIGIEVE